LRRGFSVTYALFTARTSMDSWGSTFGAQKWFEVVSPNYNTLSHFSFLPKIASLHKNDTVNFDKIRKLLHIDTIIQ